MTDRRGALRSAAVVKALAQAIETEDRHLFALLVRLGDLPGPRPNDDLAAAVGVALAATGSRGDHLLRELLAVDEARASGTSGEAYLPYVAAHTLAARIARDFDVRNGWTALEELAGDARKVVRDGVVSALIGLSDREDLAARFATWMDGYLQAAVALEVLSDRAALDRVANPDDIIARLDDATTLAEDAPRAAERSQGRRRLLEVIEITIPRFAARFAQTLDWLAKRAATKQPEIRAALEKALLGLDKKGLVDAKLDPIRKALDASRPLRRDPTDYRGPTRGRGRKAHRRGERK